MPAPDDLVWRACGEAEVPDGDAWLGPREAALLAALSAVPRRASFRLGRFAAKLLVAPLFGETDLARIEILPDADRAPCAYHDGAPLPLALSLSHRAGRGLAAAAPPDRRLGCDVERIEPRSRAFIADYFTEREARVVERAADPALIANLTWSAKESALKALRVGLMRDPRELEVTAAADGMLVVTDARGGTLPGRWRRDGGEVFTFIVA